MHYRLKIGEQDFAVDVEARTAGILCVSVNGTAYDVTVIGDDPAALPRVSTVAPARRPAPGSVPAAASGEFRPAAASVAAGAVLAPIPGLIVAIKVQVGEAVLAGQTVAVMEAMKMENDLIAQQDGVVREILVQKGSEVATGDVILRIG